MGEPDFSQYGLTPEQEDIQMLLRMKCIEHDAKKRADAIDAGEEPEDTPDYVGDANFGRTSNPIPSRSYKQTQMSGQRSMHRPPDRSVGVNFNGLFWNSLSDAQQATFHRSAYESQQGSAASRYNVPNMRRPPRALQTTLGSAVTSQAHSVPLPDDNQPKVEPQTPTSTKADPTLFSQFEVPKYAADATDQESMYSDIL